MADAAAFSMATYAIPLLVLATTDSAALTGAAFVLEWVPRLATFGLAGSMVDRHGAGRVFRVSAIMRAAVVVLAAVVLARMEEGSRTSTGTVMLLAALTGVLTEFSFVAAETTGAAASREAGIHAHRVQSVLLGIDQGATLAGPVLGGVLLQWSGPQAMLTAIAAVSLLAALIAPKLRHVRPARAIPVLEGLRIGWNTLLARPALAWLVAGMTVSNLVIGLLQAATPVIVVKELGHSSVSVGLVWSAAGAASLLAVAVSRFAIDRWGLWPIGCVAAAIAALASLLIVNAHSYPSYLALITLLMAGDSGMMVVLRTLRSRLIPTDAFGSTLSLTILILLLPYPVAGVLVAITPPTELSHVIATCAVLQAIGLALAFIGLRTHPSLHRTAP
jgi:MFS family permease